MSEKVSFKVFCQRYDFDSGLSSSMDEYKKYIDNLNVFNEIIGGCNSLVKDSRGGKREGSGRKAKLGKTTMLRVPEAYKSIIQDLISHLSEANESDVVEKAIVFNNLNGDKQEIRMITKTCLKYKENKLD